MRFQNNKTSSLERRRKERLLAPGHIEGDEVWQLSKDSADAATATGSFQLVNLISKGRGQKCVVKEKAKSGIKTVTEVLLSLY